ncbi:hypothetical protein SAMN05216604_109121 [Pseudomonas agarici]|nr:hypothetical protein SAMN05216604_109121 [Pseudomonas agarici]
MLVLGQPDSADEFPQWTGAFHPSSECDTAPRLAFNGLAGY